MLRMICLAGLLLLALRLHAQKFCSDGNKLEAHLRLLPRARKLLP